MKFDEMNPAPPVTSTRFNDSELLFDPVQRPTLDVALDPAERLADQREHEALHTEYEHDAGTGEQRPRKVRIRDPVEDAVDAERRRRDGADESERDPDPLHRLRR